MSWGSDVVSVVIPMYQARQTVNQAIDSALGQTYQPIEVIVIDDGSTDGSAEEVERHFGTAVKVIREPHRGRAAARNRGLEWAHGDLVQFLDADDILAPGKVALQRAFLSDHPELAAVYGDVECFAADEPTRRWPFVPDSCPSGDVLPYMIQTGFLLTNAILVRASWCRLVGGFDEGLHSNEDWDFWLRIAAIGGLFAYHPTDGPVSWYRVWSRHPTPPGGDLHLATGVEVLEKLAANVGRKRARQLRIRQAVGRWRFGYGRSLAEGGRRCRGVWQMARALTENRESLDYKMAWVTGSLLVGGPPARRAIEGLQRRLGAGGVGDR